MCSWKTIFCQNYFRWEWLQTYCKFATGSEVNFTSLAGLAASKAKNVFQTIILINFGNIYSWRQLDLVNIPSFASPTRHQKCKWDSSMLHVQVPFTTVDAPGGLPHSSLLFTKWKSVKKRTWGCWKLYMVKDRQACGHMGSLDEERNLSWLYDGCWNRCTVIVHECRGGRRMPLLQFLQLAIVSYFISISAFAATLWICKNLWEVDLPNTEWVYNFCITASLGCCLLLAQQSFRTTAIPNYPNYVILTLELSTASPALPNECGLTKVGVQWALEW